VLAFIPEKAITSRWTLTQHLHKPEMRSNSSIHGRNAVVFDIKLPAFFHISLPIDS
jgi:hypothetical protein